MPSESSILWHDPLHDPLARSLLSARSLCGIDVTGPHVTCDTHVGLFARLLAWLLVCILACPSTLVPAVPPPPTSAGSGMSSSLTSPSNVDSKIATAARGTPRCRPPPPSAAGRFVVEAARVVVVVVAVDRSTAVVLGRDRRTTAQHRPRTGAATAGARWKFRT